MGINKRNRSADRNKRRAEALDRLVDDPELWVKFIELFFGNPGQKKSKRIRKELEAIGIDLEGY